MDQKRPSVFDRLGRRISGDGQPMPSEGPSHVSVIVSAPPAVRRQSTSSESGSCTTTDEEDTVPPPQMEYSIKPRPNVLAFNRVNVNQRRLSSPALSKSIPVSRLSGHPSASHGRHSLTPPHLRDKKEPMYDRHGNLRVPLSEKKKHKGDVSRPNSSSPSTTSSSGTNRRTVSCIICHIPS